MQNSVMDTGACCTVLSSAFYYRIPEDIRPILYDVDHSVRFEVANDGLLTIVGQCSVNIFFYKCRSNF